MKREYELAIAAENAIFLCFDSNEEANFPGHIFMHAAARRWRVTYACMRQPNLIYRSRLLHVMCRQKLRYVHPLQIGQQGRLLCTLVPCP